MDNAEEDARAIEDGRRLFAQACEFVTGAAAPESVVRRDRSMGTARPRSPILTVPFSVPDACVLWGRRIVRRA